MDEKLSKEIIAAVDAGFDDQVKLTADLTAFPSLRGQEATAQDFMAEQYRRLGMCEPALPLYRWTRELQPDFPFGRTAYAYCLVETGHFEEGKRMAYVALSVGGDVRAIRRILTAAGNKPRDALSSARRRWC